MALDGWDEDKKLSLTIASGTVSEDVENFPAVICIQDVGAGGSGIGGFDCSAIFDAFKWTPNDIETSLWLDASDEDTITIDTGVSEWKDKSGNYNHAVQETTAEQLAYDSTNECVYNRSTGTKSISSTIDYEGSNYTLYVIARPNENSTISAKTQTNTGINYYYDERDISESHNTLFKGVVADNTYVVPLVSLSGNGIHVCETKGSLAPYLISRDISPGIVNKCSVCIKRTSTSISSSINFETSVNGVSGSISTISLSRIDLLSRYLAGSEANSDIHELLFFTTEVSTEDHERIEGYLAHKWGLTDDLPEDHPFKYAAPLVGTASKKVAFEYGDTGQQCFGEIEQFDESTRKAIYHVNIPKVLAASNTVVNLYYDKNVADNNTYIGEIGSIPAQQVWDANYKAVYHMAQDPSGGAGCILDSTSNANHGTPSGTMTSDDLIDGSTGKLIEFDGTDDKISLPAIYSAPTEVTFETLNKSNVSNTTEQRILAYDNDGIFFITSINGGVSDQIRTYVSSSSGGGWSDTTTAYPVTNKQYIVGKITANTLQTFVAGLPIGVATTYGGLTTAGSGGRNIGSGRDGISEFVNGFIGEFRLSDIARSDSYISATNKSLSDSLFTFSLSSEKLISIFNLLYGDVTFPTSSYFLFSYTITQFTAISNWSLLWGIKLYSLFSLVYNDKDIMRKYFTFPYKGAYAPKKWWKLPYKDADSVIKSFKFLWDIYRKNLVSIDVVYTLSQDSVRAFFENSYNMEDVNKVNKAFEELWHLLDEQSKVNESTVGIVVTDVTEIPEFKSGDNANNITNIPDSAKYDNVLQYEALTIDAGTDSYVISCDMTVSREIDYKRCSFESIVEITIAGTTYNFFVEGKSRSVSNGGIVYSISLISPTAKLDAPYSTTITDSLEDGILAKELIENMAAIKGISVDYELPSWFDSWFIPGYAISINDQTPIEVIRTVTEAIGAIIQTKPDGTLFIVSEYPISVPNWNTTAPVKSYSVENDIISLTDQLEVNDGFNAFNISDQGSSDEGITLEEETVNETTKYIKGFRVPFDDGVFSLKTSGGSAVTIEKLTGTGSSGEFIVNMPVQEDADDPEWEVVEFIDWTGSTSSPIYEIIDTDWIEDDLGSIQISEDGTLTVINQESVPSESLLRIKYKTKYWKWKVTGPIDKEVQFYVPEIEEK